MNSTHNFLFVSDFHIGEGRDPRTGLTHRNENFFQDDAFAQFILYHVQMSAKGDGKPWKLVLNGDLFDFLQVTTLPSKKELAEVVPDRELSDNEKKFGLGTSERATVWKLKKVAQGHPLFFSALAWFVAHDRYEIVLLKGNHDIELMWPVVQEAFHNCVAEAYENWQQYPSIFPQEADLPDTLSEDLLRKAIWFEPHFYYEPDLFFVEHGCQYDPANAFQDFEKPIITVRNERVIDLPQGSFLVRYFFNKVESVHPFADNLKPMSRYVIWILSNAPAQGIRFIFSILPDYVRTAVQMRKKSVKKVIKYVKVDQHGHTHPTEFWEKYMQIQGGIRQEMADFGKQTTWRGIGAFALALLGLIFLVVFIRMIAIGSWGFVLLALVAIVLSALGSVMLFNSIENVLTSTYLFRAAERVADLLNERPGTKFGPVRYLVIGHDHAARSWELENLTRRNMPNYRQWYVNTGSWIPVFSEIDQLERPSANLTFFRIIPEEIRDEHYGDVPQLMRWAPELGEPVLVRMFAKPEEIA